MDKTYSDIIVRQVFSSPDRSSEVIEELKVMGVTTLEELEKITPKNFKNTYKKIEFADSNYLGLLRIIMTLHNSDNYMNKARKNNWVNMGGSYVAVLSQNGIDVKEFAKKYKVNILN